MITFDITLSETRQIQRTHGLKYLLSEPLPPRANRLSIRLYRDEISWSSRVLLHLLNMICNMRKSIWMSNSLQYPGPNVKPDTKNEMRLPIRRSWDGFTNDSRNEMSPGSTGLGGEAVSSFFCEKREHFRMEPDEVIRLYGSQRGPDRGSGWKRGPGPRLWPRF